MPQSKTLVALLIAAVTLACSVSVPTGGQVTGSGEVVTLTKDFTGFEQVEIGNAFQATVQQGDDFSVIIRIDSNLEQFLRVEQVGQTLQVGLERSLALGVRDETLEVEITMPSLSGLEASGASGVTLSGFQSSDPLRLVASGASSIDGEIRAGDTTMEASGASAISLTGEAGNLVIEVSGASEVELERLSAGDVRAELSGASSAVVNASGVLDVEASGASELTYVGNPTLGTIETTGASSVEQK